MTGPEVPDASEVAPELEEAGEELGGVAVDDWSADEESTWLVCPALLESAAPVEALDAWLEEEACDVASVELVPATDDVGPVEAELPLEELLVVAAGWEHPRARVAMSISRFLMLLLLE